MILTIRKLGHNRMSKLFPVPCSLRGTFILHFYEELSHTEIAERQGISYNNVSRRVYVAKKKLKQKLSDYFLGTGEKVTITTGYGQKFSTPRKNKEKQQRVESEEKKGLETGTKQLPCDHATLDGHYISPSSHYPITSLREELVEVEKSEFMDSSVDIGDSVGQTMASVGLEFINLRQHR